MRFSLYTLIFIFAFTGFSYSQTDSSLRISMVQVSYGYYLPGGDLGIRFGSNSGVGGSFQYKSKHGWMINSGYEYYFGGKVKIEDTLFSNIQTSEGYIIDANGEYADVMVFERGFNITLNFGKVFQGIGLNKNSGIIFTGGTGLLQHKIRIENKNDLVPELTGDYKKGYDKLTNGLSINEYIGYLFIGKQRLVNFSAGFNFSQAFTQSRRTYDFNLQGQDTENRLDLLWGFKVSWIIPFYKRKPAGYYFN